MSDKAKIGADAHTVVLLQYDAGESTRTYMEFDSVAIATEGDLLCLLFTNHAL